MTNQKKAPQKRFRVDYYRVSQKALFKDQTKVPVHSIVVEASSRAEARLASLVKGRIIKSVTRFRPFDDTPAPAPGGNPDTVSIQAEHTTAHDESAPIAEITSEQPDEAVEALLGGGESSPDSAEPAAAESPETSTNGAGSSTASQASPAGYRIFGGCPLDSVIRQLATYTPDAFTFDEDADDRCRCPNCSDMDSDFYEPSYDKGYEAGHAEGWEEGYRSGTRDGQAIACEARPSEPSRPTPVRVASVALAVAGIGAAVVGIFGNSAVSLTATAAAILFLGASVLLSA